MIRSNKTDIKDNKYVSRAVGVVVVFFAMCICMLLYWSTASNEDIDVQVLKDGWNITHNDSAFQDQVLADTTIMNVQKDDTIILERVLPTEELWAPILEFKSSHSVVDIYCDNDKIYTYGRADYESGKLVGYGYHYVKLPVDYAGRTLRIELTTVKKNALSGFLNISIIRGDHLFRYKMEKDRISLALSLFLIIFGVVMLILLLATRNGTRTFWHLFWIALLAATGGFWTLCNKNLITLFTTNLVLKVYIEHISLFSLTITFLGYFVSAVFDKMMPKQLQISYIVLIAAQIVFFVISTILNVTGIVFFHEILFINHIFMVLTVAFFVIMEIICFKKKADVSIDILCGFAIALGIASFELVKFNIMKYMVGFKGDNYKSNIGIAVLVIVLTLFWDFFKRTSDIIKEDARKTMLTELAFKDELTGLANRRKCEDIIREYDEKEDDFCVISFDLNFLKKINDTNGHEAGDIVLIQFGKVLLESFPKEATIGRMGGDEFLVVLESATEETVIEGIKKLDSCVQRINNSERKGDIPLSAAYGEAFRRQCDTVQAMMAKADARMYENKRRTKTGRV